MWSASIASEETPITQSTIDKSVLGNSAIGTKELPYLLQSIPGVVATSDNGLGIGGDRDGILLLMVISFALFRESKVLQFVIMAIINIFWMKGLGYPVDFLGREWFIPQQAFAMLALIPIWLYNGEQGPYNKTIRRVCYAFYPAHILALVTIGTIAEFCLN